MNKKESLKKLKVKGDDGAISRISAAGQVITSLVALTSILFSAYTLQATQDQVQINQDQSDISRQGQASERFSRAIDQLGSAQLSIRIGGVYSLEQLTLDSPKDQPSVVEILTAFVRGANQSSNCSKLQTVPADLQAAMNVLGRRDAAKDSGRLLDLSDSCLPGINLRKLDLRNAVFIGATLSNAKLAEVNLQGAVLSRAKINGTELISAILVNVDASGAELKGAFLNRSNMTAINLSQCDLSGADLGGAVLNDAVLQNSKHDRSTNTEGTITNFKTTSKWW